MPGVYTPWKKLFLRNLKWVADEAGIGLSQALKNAARTQLDTVSQGMVLVGTAANGASASFSIPANGPGPSAIVELLSELLDVHDKAAAQLTSPTDDELFEVMMMHLVPVRHYAHSYGGLIK